MDGNLISNSQNGAFTTDGQYSIADTDQTQSSGGTTLFLVRSMGVAAPFLARQLSNGYAVWSYPLAGSKVLVIDNFVDTDGGTGLVATSISTWSIPRAARPASRSSRAWPTTRGLGGSFVRRLPRERAFARDLRHARAVNVRTS